MAALPGRALALLAGLFAALAVAAAARAETVQLAPALPAAGSKDADAPDEAVVQDQSWRMCRVHAKVLLNMPERSKIVYDDERLLALGEAIDFERDVQMTSGTRAALVRLHARIRASVARSPGVLYVVTTDAELVSAIGFESDDVGREQVRNAVMDVVGPGARLHEAFVSPDLQARIVLAISAEPVFGREEQTAMDLVRPGSVEIRRFKVEALLKEGEKLTKLDETELSALDGSEATYSMARFAADAKPGVHPALKFGSSVTLVKPEPVPRSGYEKDHVVKRTPAGGSYEDSHEWKPETGFMGEHEVVQDASDDPDHFTIRRKNNKISQKKRDKLVAQQQIQSVRDWAIERSKTLPSGESVPEGFARESLSLHVTPLHATASMMQVEIRIEGNVRLPHEEVLVPLATKIVEHLPRGEPFDIAVSELVRDQASPNDYILRITPEP